MINPTTLFPIANNAQGVTRDKQGSSADGYSLFDATLTNAYSQANMKEMASAFIRNMVLSLDNILNNLTNPDASITPAFPFSGEFEATFGKSGPLLDFINATTTRLNLNAGQNQALQTIAIRNKDITYTPANVQKIADELKQAGIG